jgi:hypothetical protein
MAKYWTLDGSYYTENENFIKDILLKNILQDGKEFYTITDESGRAIAMAVVKK